MHLESLANMLDPFGVPAGALVLLDGPLGPEHLSHLDIHPLGTQSRFQAQVDAVVEIGGRPAMYVKRGGQGPHVAKLASLLAQRGGADYLALVEPGQLTLLALQPRKKGTTSRALLSTNADDRNFVPGLASGTIEPLGKRVARTLTKGLFDLLQGSTRALTKVEVEPDDALALVGRGLFFRFLVDRQIVVERDKSGIVQGLDALENAMSTPDCLEATSDWLDGTFNGHLLPLNIKTALRSEQRRRLICEQLTRILTRTDAGGQLSFEWGRLDFGHIPVGLVSEVYESWSHEYRANEAKRDSVWYTPVPIAELMVSEALASMEQPHAAKVLDPAAGAGVFLVTAFRALVAARWKHDGVRPDRKAVRETLYTQLAGFDVNDAALRLAALALYLTALELEPSGTFASRHADRGSDVVNRPRK